ncbi:MAG: radical SAM protein [Desulfomonile tiedjei]|uniref:peptidylprolyl isomerase n=1 Tax=Desulfomonile tiedjei TaxID=2358 RepID=A0A9D6V476_9BACT|nr:radical SAM protein [Desulfomonile tiedjei]
MSFIFINVNHDVGYESSESIPISLGYILATLKAQEFDGVILDDLRDRPLTLKNLEKWIRRIDPWVIGFTAYQSTMDRIRFLCRYIKSRHRKIHIVLGGPQAVLMPSEALRELGDVDVLTRADGESVLLEMARALEAGDPMESVHGITCRCSGKILDTGNDLEIPDDLDMYPSPYLSNLLNLEGKSTAILLSSRGCTHVCWFCITPKVCRGKVRYHSLDRVLDEMQHLTARGVGRFWFADPNFTEDRQRAEQFLQRKIDLGVKTPFWFQTRADMIDSALLKKFAEAGADTVAFGLESGSPGVLAKTNKGILLEQLRENVSIAQSLGMETELFSIFGLPDETVEDARKTMEFVRSLGIAIQSNSGSQQMQLYFGSIYERNPAKFGISPLNGHRPAYVSVGERYETSAMTEADMRKVRNMWALANEQMEMDVYYKQRTFEILDFLLENREDLQDEPSLHAYGALTSSVIEEFELLERFLEGYEKIQSSGDSEVNELISALSFFEETDQPAGPSDRVIFDSRSWIGGVPFTGISGKYWDVLLGKGLLLPEFEEGFQGAKQGDEIRFTFVFPDDYGQEELQGKQVEVHAKIHKVFKSPRVNTLEDLRKLSIKNHYPFPDLDLLREQNEILYYFALRDADPQVLLKTPSHFLAFSHKLAKLGKRDEVTILAAMLKGKPTALNALADTLMAAGKYSWALEYYRELAEEVPSAWLKQVRCLLNLGRSEEALRIMDGIPESSEPAFQETLLQSLRVAQPDSSRIPSLEHHVLNIRVNAALSREMAARGSSAPAPIVHGETENSK